MKPARAALAALLLAACSKDPAPAPAAAPPAPAAPAPSPAAPATPASSRPQAGRAARPAAPAPELTLGAFKSFTKKRNPEVRRCYEAALANEPTLRGKVTLAFSILPSGGIGEVRVARSTFRSSAVPSCVASVVRAWKTPFRPEEAVDVEYPLDFGPR